MTRTEYPHPGHFIASSKCQFRRCTFVGDDSGGVIVSTVGEYKPGGHQAGPEGMEAVGSGDNDFFETAAWPAKRREADPGWECCQWAADVEADSLVFRRVATATEAQALHEAVVEDVLAGREVSR
jgi:hypothetical protein